MKMKKIAAIIFSAAMVLNMGAAAMATGETTPSISVGGTDYTDSTTVTIGKVYKQVGEGTSPEETFTLTQVGDGRVVDGDATSAPALGTITGARYEAGAASKNGTSGTITVALPAYTTVGVYEYTLQETDNNTAGVSYRSEQIKLVVTVMQGDDGKVRVAAVHTETDGGKKQGTFDNTYSAGSLAVTKKVTGNLGDKDKLFNVTVTFTAPEGETIKGSITYNNNDNGQTQTIEPEWDNNTAVAKIALADGDTVTFTNIPYGVTYTVVEDNYKDYTTSYKMNDADAANGNGKIDTPADAVEITNNKGGAVDTGINLDSMPYIMILALVAVCAVVMFARKRFSANR